MLTYRVRPRLLKLEKDTALSFPNRGTVVLHLLPKQPFGEAASDGRTLVRNAKNASVFFNANTGHHYSESDPSLAPLDVTIDTLDQTIRFRGTSVEVEQAFETPADLERLLYSLYFTVPVLLGLEFGDPPTVERVDGHVGGVPYRWELARWQLPFHVTDQQGQEAAVIRAWERLPLVAEPTNRRLLAATHYFHTARRLLGAAATPGEFLAEALLNFAKVLEILFPVQAEDGGTIDATRRGLASLEYDDVQVERAFVPALALRNKIDVGHVDLTIFTTDQLALIHAFAESAENNFRDLLNTVFERVSTGTFQVPPGIAEAPTGDDLQVIERLRALHEEEGNASDAG